MATIHPGRYSAEIEGDLVVFLIGMRLNRPWKLHHWWPVLAGMRRMLAELARHPEPGLLGAGTGVLHGGPAVVQYWRGFEHLERFARDPAPCPGWGWPPPAGTCPSPSGASRRPSGSAPSRTTRWRPRLELGIPQRDLEKKSWSPAFGILPALERQEFYPTVACVSPLLRVIDASWPAYRRGLHVQPPHTVGRCRYGRQVHVQAIPVPRLYPPGPYGHTPHSRTSPGSRGFRSPPHHISHRSSRSILRPP
jgi:hypothetical protein